jgi:hypothetical protein
MSPKDPVKVAGGNARAKSLSPTRRREIAQKAAFARWGGQPKLSLTKKIRATKVKPMTALIVQPPIYRFKPPRTKAPSVFLAGSIEMGAAEDWQPVVITELESVTSVIFNPRRDDWNPEWEQKIDCPEFNCQVNWELDMIDKADIIVFHFDPNTKSPITLMELGIVAANRRGFGTYVSCPNGFYRKGNVDIVCERYGIPMFDNLTDMVKEARSDAYQRQK